MSQVNFWMIEHLGYFSIEIITEIQLFTSIKQKVWINSLPTQLKVPTEEQMFLFVWDYLAQKIDIQEDAYDWSMKKKKQEKIWYDKGVKMQYFFPDDFVLLQNSTSHLRKLTKQWREPFIIDSFGRNHGVLYILKTLDRERAPNTYYDDYLRIFRLQKGYLRPTDKEPLQVIHNLRFKRKKNWNNKDISYLLYANYFMQIVSPPLILFFTQPCMLTGLFTLIFVIEYIYCRTLLEAADFSEGKL